MLFLHAFDKEFMVMCCAFLQTIVGQNDTAQEKLRRENEMLKDQVSYSFIYFKPYLSV